MAARPARGRPPVQLGGSCAGRGQRRRRFRPPFYAAERPEAEAVLRVEGFGPVCSECRVVPSALAPAGVGHEGVIPVAAVPGAPARGWARPAPPGSSAPAAEAARSTAKVRAASCPLEESGAGPAGPAGTMDQSVVAEHPVTLIIKAPNQKYTDQTISCFLEWTVGKLKSHLSKVYPSKPLTKDQRLVYSGRLLPDHLQLKDVLRKQDEYHMVHLVCTSRTPPSSPKPSTSRESHGASTSSSSSNLDRFGSTAASPTNQEASSLNTSADGVRHRNLPQAHSNPTPSHQFPYLMQGNIGNQFPGQGVPAGFSMYPAFSPLQMIWWQQMYVRQYYMQYQAAVSAQVTSSTEPARSAVAQAVNSERAPANEPAAVPNVAVQENRPVNQNVQMNAQGGPVVNEEDFNRDWLDWMYTFSRAAILLSIVYFYSSFSRFVMVMGAMLLVYLHQAGWFPFRQEGGQQQAANNAEVNRDGQHANNPDLEEMERLMDDGIDEDSGEDAGEDGNTEQQPGFMASAWSFITTFFTSLIPEGPPQVGN